MELDLDAKGLCKVIQQCRESGVSIRYGDLTISLDPNFSPALDVQYPSGNVLDMTIAPKEQEIADLGAEQIAAKEGQEYLDQLLIEDPVKYEELISSGEFEDE